jgi:hypothetical protein
MKKFNCMMNRKPCTYLADEKPELGWNEFQFETIEEASLYMHKFLGDFSPGQEYFLTGARYDLYGSIFEIVIGD